MLRFTLFLEHNLRLHLRCAAVYDMSGRNALTNASATRKLAATLTRKLVALEAVSLRFEQP